MPFKPRYPIRKGDNIKIKLVSCNDTVGQSIHKYFECSNNFINKALTNSNNNILIHCFAGRSRSTTLVIAYLMRHHQMSLVNAFKLVKSNRPISKPNREFLLDLKKYEQFLNFGSDWKEERI